MGPWSSRIDSNTDRRIALKGHFPNLVAFTNLLDGLQHYSKLWKRRVARITHDTQSEFEKTLAIYHDMFSHASPEPFHWAGEVHIFQKVVGSEFAVVEDSLSSGIQVADIILWLYGQSRKGKNLPSACSTLLRYALTHAWESDFSFIGVETALLEKWGEKLLGPATEEELQKARPLLDKLEASRLASMAQYEKDKLPPFTRSSTERQIES